MDERQKPLERWTGPTGVCASVERAGQGTPVLFAHEQLLHRKVWTPLYDTIGTRPYASLDLPGHGDTPLDAPGATGGFDRFGEAILEVVNGLQWERLVVVGHGLGALAALEAAHLLPGRFAGLVLIGLPHDPHDDEVKVLRSIPEMLKAGLPDDDVEAWFGRWCSAGFREAHPEAKEQIRTWLAANDPSAAADVVDRLLSINSVQGRYQNVAVPKLIVTLEDDHYTPGAGARDAAKEWPATMWRKLSGGHLPLLEDEEELVEAVNSALRRADRERAERGPKTRW